MQRNLGRGAGASQWHAQGPRDVTASNSAVAMQPSYSPQKVIMGGGGGSDSHGQSGGQLMHPPSLLPASAVITPAVPPVMNLGGMLLRDIAQRVKNLGFPACVTFLMGNLIERYFASNIDIRIDDSCRNARENIDGLIGTFIFQRGASRVLSGGPWGDKDGGGGGSGDGVGPLSAVDEMKLLMIIQTHLEQQDDVSLRYCVFDAIFGGITMNYGNEFELLCKLVSLCISLGSEGVLLCVAMWMSTHTTGALGLATFLYHEFCILLPDASSPLRKLASLSSHFAYQLASAFTTLYPLHVVGKLLPGVNVATLQPPLKMLDVVLQWVKLVPDFLYATPHHHRETAKSRFQLFHSSSDQDVQSPITGIILWSILAPIVVSSSDAQEPKLMIGTTLIGSKNVGSKGAGSKDAECGFQELLAQLHAEVLSALLSGQSSSSRLSSLTSDDVAMIVATLLAYSQKQEVKLREMRQEEVKKKEVNRKQEARDGGYSERLEQCVERFAQFLQISISAQVLELQQKDLKSVSSTLPKNRLLELVISHCFAQLPASSSSASLT